MFMPLVSKIYMVNESSKGIWGRDMRYYELGDYRHELASFPTFESFCVWLTSLREERGGHTILLVKDKDFNRIAIDYLTALGLGYDEYVLIRNHSNFCTHYCDNVNELISRFDDTVPMPTREDFDVKVRRIRGHFEIFPAEYAINCLDKEWARKKFRHFRAVALYDTIRELQIKEYQSTGKLTLFPEVSSSHCDARKLRQPDAYLDVVQRLEDTGEDASRFRLSLEDWVNTSSNVGYNRYGSFKFNSPLMRHLQEKEYRIDAMFQ